MKSLIALICTISFLIIGIFNFPNNDSFIDSNDSVHIEENYQQNIKNNSEDSSKEISTETDFLSSKEEALKNIPEYSSKPYTIVNNNVPFFNDSDLVTYSYEEYSALDSLGRCGTVVANVGKDIMPSEERGNIGMIKPSGWHTVKYQGIDGNYLYNRCHLLGYQLTAENANVKNLITGTRYMNVQGMLPFENQVAEYVKETNNHVLLRVTPIFEGNNLLASGVLMEAKSVEDNGAGVLFNVYCYNVQPGVTIDYTTGESEGPEFTGSTQTIPKDENTSTVITPSIETTEVNKEITYILNKNSKKIHYPYCSSVDDMSEKNKLYFYGTLSEAKADGYESCGRCNP